MIKRCTTPHVSSLRAGYNSLTWYREHRFTIVRVVQWTCSEHQITSYELCTAGGLGLFRRTVAAPNYDAVVVSYSDAWLMREAHAKWFDLMSGRLA
jgi:hypothetical protein